MKKDISGPKELSVASIISLLAFAMPGTAAAIEFVCSNLGPDGEFTVGTECISNPIDFAVDQPTDAAEFGQHFGTVHVELRGQELDLGGPTLTEVTEYSYRLTGLGFSTTRFEVVFEEPLSLLTVGFLSNEPDGPGNGDIAPDNTLLVKDCFGADYIFGICPDPGVELALGYQADFDNLGAGDNSEWLRFLSTTFPVHADGIATGSSSDMTRTLIGNMAFVGPGGITASPINVAVPEPATVLLLGTGMVALVAAWRRLRRPHREDETI